MKKISTISMKLETGTIRVESISTQEEMNSLFGLAERNNPKRAFLFVSKVLGRHIPVKPSVMRKHLNMIAYKIPKDIEGPVLFTGMAETAIGLGAGVHDSWTLLTGRSDSIFLSTTRAKFPNPIMAKFDESHSHASRHIVYTPRNIHDLNMIRNAKTIIMVDDEASTGNTFQNLARSLIGGEARSVNNLICCMLTDWSNGSLENIAGVPTRTVSILSGEYFWEADPSGPIRILPDADTGHEPRISPIPRNDDGRLGRSFLSLPDVPSHLLHSLERGGGPIAIIGSGEHVWEPFLMAERLEKFGFDVRFSSTTRSPIMIGGAIERGIKFKDHEGLGVGAYLYNVDPDVFSRIVLCVDTSLGEIDPSLMKALRCDLILGKEFIPRKRIEKITETAAAAAIIKNSTHE